MANQINLQPQILNLALYAGDGVEFKLVCKDGNKDPVDITGTVTAQIRLDRLAATDPIVEFTTDMVDAYLGIVVLSLSEEQTRDLVMDPSAKAGKFLGVWDIQWNPANTPSRTLCQGTVECVSDVTR
ncbi:MAG: hypothetical protein ACJ8BW_00775 [Ktedonobacteraceae bacterium]|jgi:hypothetical protein